MRGRTFEDVEAYTAEPVDVGVVDLGKEADFGRGHGVVVGEKQLELEDAACSPGFVSGSRRKLREGSCKYLRRGTVQDPRL